jgi:hypothetical protein
VSIRERLIRLGDTYELREDTVPKYVGFLRGTEDAMAGLSPAEAEHTLERYIAWSEDLEKAGNPPSGGGLSRRGRVVRRTGTELDVTNGPFVESSEILGGYIAIDAADLDEAEKIFGSHPHLDFGSIEVRKIGERGCED